MYGGLLRDHDTQDLAVLGWLNLAERAGLYFLPCLGLPISLAMTNIRPAEKEGRGCSWMREHGKGVGPVPHSPSELQPILL